MNAGGSLRAKSPREGAPWADPTSRNPTSRLQYSSGVDSGTLRWIYFKSVSIYGTISISTSIYLSIYVYIRFFFGSAHMVGSGSLKLPIVCWNPSFKDPTTACRTSYIYICTYIHIYIMYNMYIYIYIEYPPYADLSHVHTAIWGSALVGSADMACFHIGKLGLRVTFNCYKRPTSSCFWIGPYDCNLAMSPGRNLVFSPRYQIQSAQVFQLFNSL